MDNIEFDEVIRYLTDSSILVLTPVRLFRIYCPFRVISIVDFPKIDITGYYDVTRVLIDRDLHTVYIINGDAYNSKHFLLML